LFAKKQKDAARFTAEIGCKASFEKTVIVSLVQITIRKSSLSLDRGDFFYFDCFLPMLVPDTVPNGCHSHSTENLTIVATTGNGGYF